MAPRVDILTDAAIQSDSETLARAWSSPRGFVVLPDRHGLDNHQIERSLSAWPDDLQADGFGLLTSGSTGAPKIVIGRRPRTEALARELHQKQQLEEIEVALVALPLSYSFAFVNQWVWAQVHKRRFICTAGLARPDAFRQALLSIDRAQLCLVGSQATLMLRHFAGESFPGIHRLLFAGGRFPQELVTSIQAMFPSAILYNNYGCVEAMPRLSLRLADASSEPANVGLPLSGIELKSDEARGLCFRSPYSAVAEIIGDSVTRYDAADWIATGDTAQPEADGSWRLTGRVSEVFKRHGEKVSIPDLLSTVLSIWSGQAAFFREPDATGEASHILVLAPTPSETELREILLAIRRRHVRAQWPVRVEGVANLPLLPSGKPDTQALAALEGKVPLWKQHLVSSSKQQ